MQRSACSSSALGHPKYAITPSPRYWRTQPPYSSSTIVLQTFRYSWSTCLHSPRSCCISAVDPTMSQNITVRGRDSASGTTLVFTAESRGVAGALEEDEMVGAWDRLTAAVRN